MTLASLRQFALSLAAVTEEPHHQFSSFRVHGKIFVTIPPGEVTIHVLVDEPTREMALDLYADCVEKLRWGDKVLGLKVHLDRAAPSVVTSLVTDAYHQRAKMMPRNKKKSSN
jgi:YjbR